MVRTATVKVDEAVSILVDELEKSKMRSLPVLAVAGGYERRYYLRFDCKSMRFRREKLGV